MKNDLFDLDNRIKVSWKWASKQIDCTLQGITKTNGCGGRCCTTPYFYPPKSNGGRCFYLGQAGCILSKKETPAKCLLYPFVIKNNLLVLYGRALLGSCKNCYTKTDNKIDIIWVNMRVNIIELFGEEQYTRVLNDINSQKDSYIILPDWWEAQIKEEDKLEQLNLIPLRRNT